MADNDQVDVFAFLSNCHSYGLTTGIIEHRETHGAHVFLVGAHAWKVKRAVRFDYMDFSTIEKRHQALAREIDVNRRFAPDIYLTLLRLTRRADGGIEFSGIGPTIDWVLKMRRFDEADMLDARAERGAIDCALVDQLATVVRDSHVNAAIALVPDASKRLGRVIDGLESGLRSATPGLATEGVESFVGNARQQLTRIEHLIDRRGLVGQVRRCHGDLHLGNIVVLGGRPVLFDALEFNEDMATVDVLYDLAFLLLDLFRRGLKDQANHLLNRYISLSGCDEIFEGLAALPLYMALRAGIRAMVLAQKGAQYSVDLNVPAADDAVARARGYLTCGRGLMDSARVHLIVLAGNDACTMDIAARLAPTVGAAPGAICLSMKAAMRDGRGELEILMRHLALTLRAGYSAIVTGAFLQRHDQQAFETLAMNLGSGFAGIELKEPSGVASGGSQNYRRESGWVTIDGIGDNAELLRQCQLILSQKSAVESLGPAQ